MLSSQARSRTYDLTIHVPVQIRKPMKLFYLQEGTVTITAY